MKFFQTFFPAAIALAILTGCASVPKRTTPAADPLTVGWTPMKFTYEVQHPYDLNLSDRYRYDANTDTHDFWVFFADKPHAPPPNETTARTEMRLQTYSAGEHMFDADVNVRPGAFACIAQVFDDKHGPVTMFVVKPDGTVAAGGNIIATNVIGRWWNLKITNDPVVGGKINAYVNDVLVGTFSNHGARDYYFKCGVYSRKDSGRSEVLYRNIKMWVKPATTPTPQAKGV